MIQKLAAYAVMAGLFFILFYSTAKISFLTFSTTPPKRYAVDLDALPPPPLNRDHHVVTDTYIKGNGNEEHQLPTYISPINQQKFDANQGNSGPSGVRNVLPRLLSLSSQTRKIDETSLPYPCGAIVYVHLVPGDAGDALNEWIAQLVKSNQGASLISSEEYESKQAFIKQVEANIIRTIDPNEWTIIHSHAKHGLSLVSDELILYSWRDAVERQQCAFIAAAIFSDPLDHSIKHTKRRFAQCNCDADEFGDGILQDIATSNPWMGQLDHFLFNSAVELSSTMMTKDKVKRAIQLLISHFDLVLIDGKGHGISDALLKITGWSSSTLPRKAAVLNDDEGPRYSKNLVNAFGKLSAKNGDADFMDAVNHVYFNSLGYLMLQ